MKSRYVVIALLSMVFLVVGVISIVVLRNTQRPSIPADTSEPQIPPKKSFAVQLADLAETAYNGKLEVTEFDETHHTYKISDVKLDALAEGASYHAWLQDLGATMYDLGPLELVDGQFSLETTNRLSEPKWNLIITRVQNEDDISGDILLFVKIGELK